MNTAASTVATTGTETGQQRNRQLTLRLRQQQVADGEEAELQQELRKAQASDLHETMPLANLASFSVCLVVAWMFWHSGHSDFNLLIWLLLGLSGSLLRLVIYRWYRTWIDVEDNHQQTVRFLRLGIGVSVLTGGMFGWGWWMLRLDASVFETGFLFVHVAYLFGALFSYSTFIPAYFGYVSSGLLPAIALTTQQYMKNQMVWGWSLPVGLSLIGALSLMFAYRSTQVFRSHLLLQERVFRLLDEVTQNRDEAVKATLDKSRFLASVSHDLRQPMHAINLYLASLARSYEQQLRQPHDTHSIEVVKTSIASLQESTNYLNTMFESLLDISRLDAGAVNVDIKHTSLLKLVGQLEMDYSHLAQAEGLRFDLRLPAQFHLMEVWTDTSLLERLLRNLIVNAIRYTQQGGVRLSIVRCGKYLDFRVIDTGSGIERNMRQRVFDEFFQVPGSQKNVLAATTIGRGIGLGLSIANRLAKRLQTHIRLHSHVGHGSVFALQLPMRFALRPHHDAGVATTADPSVGLSLPAGLFLVLIDDDLSILRSTRLLLESYGFEVLAAASSTEAIQRLGLYSKVPDLILSDWRLGAEDGLECIARLRDEFNEDIPSILITGDTSIEHVKLFRESGLQVLHKPIAGDVLLQQIKLLLAQNRQQTSTD